jgi:hypothetical protein
VRELGIMDDIPLAAVTSADLPLEPEPLRAFAFEPNRLACTLEKQLESRPHQIAR